MTVHSLKTINPYFTEVWNHDKHFEVRYNDRDYKIWDYLILREYVDEMYTGREMLCSVTYILKDFVGLKEGYVVMGISILNTTSEYVNKYGNCSVAHMPGKVKQ